MTLTIRPHSGGPARDVQLSRERLTFNPVSSQVCRRTGPGPSASGGSSVAEGDGKVGYIRVATFSKQTTENVKAAIHQLQSEGASRPVCLQPRQRCVGRLCHADLQPHPAYTVCSGGFCKVLKRSMTACLARHEDMSTAACSSGGRNAAHDLCMEDRPLCEASAH